MLTLLCRHYWYYYWFQTQMPLNISMAKYPYEYASLASWLQPRWVVEAPAQDQSLRLTRRKLHEQKTRHELIYSTFCVAGWRCKLTSRSCSCRNLKTSENLRSFEYMLAHWPVCDLLSKHRAMVLPAWSVVMCPKIQRKTPKLIMPFHRLWPKHYIENHRNARKKPPK